MESRAPSSHAIAWGFSSRPCLRLHPASRRRRRRSAESGRRSIARCRSPACRRIARARDFRPHRMVQCRRRTRRCARPHAGLESSLLQSARHAARTGRLGADSNGPRFVPPAKTDSGPLRPRRLPPFEGGLDACVARTGGAAERHSPVGFRGVTGRRVVAILVSAISGRGAVR